MVAKLFITPFAADGDRLPIPTERDPDGAVSFELGFGVDYERQLGIDPAAKNIKRETVNELFFDLTDAVGFQQQHGLPEWTSDMAAIGGYAKNVLVWSVNDVWQSQLDGNTSIPSEETDFWFPSKRFMGGGGAGNFGLVGPTVIAVGGAYSYKISPYNSFAQYTATATKGTVSISGDTLMLVIAPAETAPATKVVVTRSDGVDATFEIAIGAQSVAKPSIVAPTDGSLNVPLGPTLTASAFATYPSGADTQLNADWRIRDMLGAVVWQSLANAVNKITIQVPDNTLPLNTQLQADTRQRGTVLPVSEWSVPVVFTTTNQSISTPTITAPLNGATGIGATPTFTATAFATNPLGADTHASSDWQLKNSLGEVIWSSVADTVHKTSITLPAGILSVSSQYTMEVRYNGNVLQPSQWSPVVSFTTASAFAYDRYVSAGLSGPPYCQLYGQDIDTFRALGFTGGDPSSAVLCCAFSQDGVYSAYGQQSTPYLLLYKRTGNSFARIALSDIPPNAARGVSFSPDGTYMAICLGVSPFLIIYKRSGDVFTKLPNPATLPTDTASCIAFSADGLSLAVCFGTTQSNVYNRVGDTFTRVATPSSNGGFANGMCFSADGVYLTIATTGTPFINIYKRSGDVFAKLPNPSTLPTGVGNDVAFSADGVYLSIAHTTTPFVTNYKRSGDTFTKIADLGTLPTGAATGVAYSLDGVNLAVCHNTSPYISLYKRSGDTLLKLSNPASLPASNPLCVAYYPPVPGA